MKINKETYGIFAKPFTCAEGWDEFNKQAQGLPLLPSTVHRCPTFKGQGDESFGTIVLAAPPCHDEDGAWTGSGSPIPGVCIAELNGRRFVSQFWDDC